MRSLMLFLFVFLLGIFPALVIGQEVSDPTSILPIWVDSVMVFLMGIPKVGPIVVWVVKGLGFVAVTLSSIVVLIQAICGALVTFFNFTGATGFANKVTAFADKILPWIKRFSMHNTPTK